MLCERCGGLQELERGKKGRYRVTQGKDVLEYRLILTAEGQSTWWEQLSLRLWLGKHSFGVGDKSSGIIRMSGQISKCALRYKHVASASFMRARRDFQGGEVEIRPLSG